ncbi:MAG: hypothetical protein ACTHKH_14940 [Trinickia sp.]
MSEPLVNPASLPALEGYWDVDARYQITLRVNWRWQPDGTGIAIEASQIAGPGAALQYRASLSFGDAAQRQVKWAFGIPGQQIDVTLSLRRRRRDDAQSALLWANVPLTQEEFFDDAISTYPLEPVPPVPPEPPSPEPPSPPDDDTIVQALPGAADLLPFLWLRPPTPHEQCDARHRYTSVPAEPSLALFAQLAAISGADAAKQKRAAATAFRTNAQPAPDATFIASIAMLPANVSQLLEIRLALLAIDGPRALAYLNERAAELLGMQVAGFLAQDGVKTARGNLWQTVATVALVGTAADATLAAQLVDLLRTLHYLDALDASDTALERETVRHETLCATPALPDSAAAWGLSAVVAAGGGAQSTDVTGQWRLLGVGQLSLVRHRLTGYAAGELAEVVNLMPRERQERHERSVMASETQRGTHDAHARVDEHSTRREAANELADTLKELMSAEAGVRNLSDVTPSYSNLNLMLSGSAAEGGARLALDANSAAHLMQRMSEAAVRKWADRASRQRSEVWREWREMRASQCIDNAQGGRLVGVYRWVDRLMRVWLKRQGGRIVLALEVESPARQWIGEVAARGPVALERPAPLPAFSTPDGQGYASITPTNYQRFGAQYGLTDLPAPPVEPIVVSAQVNRATVADASLLTVPPGYAVASGKASLALADASFGIVANVGGYDLPAHGPTKPSEVTISVPSAASSDSVGAPTALPPAPPPAWLQTTTLADSAIGLTGPVPVTVITDAPLFGLSVELSCNRVRLTDPTTQATVDPLMVDWQMRVYNRLLDAWQARMRAYDAELSRRIELASAGRTDEIQRETLKRESIALLSSTRSAFGASVWDACIEWSSMSWYYDSPGGVTSPYPADSAESRACTESASARLFQAFLHATAAAVLLPLKPARQTELLYALQWQPSWPAPAIPSNGFAAQVPVTESTVPLLEEQRTSNASMPAATPPWTLRLPLPLLYLQEGDALPCFPASLTTNPWIDHDGICDDTR